MQLLLIAYVAAGLTITNASELEGEQLYRVTTVRAAPGAFPELLDWIADNRQGERPPLVMRHSQGDQWDLMILAATESASAVESGFLAPAGKADELVEQRRMENDYLSAIGLTPNMIFRRAAGSDVDVFTIGFHEDMAAFAAPSEAGDEEREAAAKSAGFKERADISFYLRTLISGHHDTLAVKVD